MKPRTNVLRGLCGHKSPLKHGTNPAGDAPHTKFKTETEHEEYHDINPTKDLNEAEMKEASKPENTIEASSPNTFKQSPFPMQEGTIGHVKAHASAFKFQEYMEMAGQASSMMGGGDEKDEPKGITEAFKTGKKSDLSI